MTIEWFPSRTYTETPGTPEATTASAAAATRVCDGTAACATPARLSVASSATAARRGNEFMRQGWAFAPRAAVRVAGVCRYGRHHRLELRVRHRGDSSGSGPSRRE